MLVAHYGWGETFACGYFVPGVLRYVWVLNSTWCVNSLEIVLCFIYLPR